MRGDAHAPAGCPASRAGPLLRHRTSSTTAAPTRVPSVHRVRTNRSVRDPTNRCGHRRWPGLDPDRTTELPENDRQVGRLRLMGLDGKAPGFVGQMRSSTV